MKNLLIYLDNCCFNRPYDKQDVLRVKLETEAKLYIQEQIKTGCIDLAWSFMLDYENDRNPFDIRRDQISLWKDIACVYIPANDEIKLLTEKVFNDFNITGGDAVHIACAVFARCVYFITTDHTLIKRASGLTDIKVINPIDFLPLLEEN